MLALTVLEILDHAYPGRGGWTVFGEEIIAGDGGDAPSMEEIEVHRAAATAAHQVANELRATQKMRESLVLSRAQFGEMLIRRDLKSQVIAAIESVSDSTAREIMLEWYEYAPEVARLSPKVDSVRLQLEISDTDLDTWFAEAMEYE